MKKDYSLVYAEDDELIREGYLKFLNHHFTKVYGARNGQEALDLYEHCSPDIMILDINMPLIDGLKVAKKIRQKDDKTKILILTAYSDKGKLLEAVELNLCKYLIKPVSTFELRETLEGVVKKIKNNSEDDIYILNEKFAWNRTKKAIYKNNKEIYLTKKEMLLLELFFSNPNKIHSNIDILNYVWDEDISEEFSTSKLRSLFSKLRNKLGENIFISIYAVGYKLK